MSTSAELKTKITSGPLTSEVIPIRMGTFQVPNWRFNHADHR